MDKLVDLTLVIPCYNEEKNLPLLIAKCASLSETERIEVIFVNNGSSDGSAQIFLDMLEPYPNFHCVSVETNEGYGNGILQGLKQAKGRILSWTHADMQCDPLDVLDGYEYFKDGDLNVFVKGLRYGRPLLDSVFTFGMSIFETILLQKPMRDINAQPTVFHKSFFQLWEKPPIDFSLDLYAYLMAKKSKLVIKRFPVKFSKRLHGQSNWNTSLMGKYKFIKRTLAYSFMLKRKLG